MIPRIVLEPSLLWFLYVAPNKDFFVLVHWGPLSCLCFYKSFYLSDTLAWTGGWLTVQQVDSLTAVLQPVVTGENKNSNKTNNKLDFWVTTRPLIRCINVLILSIDSQWLFTSEIWILWMFFLRSLSLVALVSLSWFDHNHLAPARYRRS